MRYYLLNSIHSKLICISRKANSRTFLYQRQWCTNGGGEDLGMTDFGGGDEPNLTQLPPPPKSAKWIGSSKYT